MKNTIGNKAIRRASHGADMRGRGEDWGNCPFPTTSKFRSAHLHFDYLHTHNDSQLTGRANLCANGDADGTEPSGVPGAGVGTPGRHNGVGPWGGCLVLCSGVWKTFCGVARPPSPTVNLLRVCGVTERTGENLRIISLSLSSCSFRSLAAF